MRRSLIILCFVLSALHVGAGERAYYKPYEKYDIGTFFSQLGVPCNFGVGFVPDKNSAEQFAYYSAMFLDWRYYKSFGWYAQAGLDTHDHNYDLNRPFPGQEQYKDRGYNVSKGTVFNMQLMAGGGYRIPLIPISQFQEFYEHPWLNQWNISFLLQFGCSWSRTKYAVDMGDGTYRLEDQHHVFPVMKVGTAVEVFTSRKFSVFLACNYMQHLRHQPWDTSSEAGTLSFSLGFGGFFNDNP